MASFTMFPGKLHSTRFQGILTARGSAAFEDARAALRRLYMECVRKVPPSVSDADTVEYLALGAPAVRRLFLGGDK